ncbi:winged helix-turn-helix domain-containing protein, partial [Vibrio cholerae]
RDLVSEHFSEDIVTFSALKLQKSTHQCWLSDSEVILTKKEFAFLEMLMKTPGQLVKQTDLLREVWGHSHTADTH